MTDETRRSFLLRYAAIALATAMPVAASADDGQNPPAHPKPSAPPPPAPKGPTSKVLYGPPPKPQIPSHEYTPSIVVMYGPPNYPQEPKPAPTLSLRRPNAVTRKRHSEPPDRGLPS